MRLTQVIAEQSFTLMVSLPRNCPKLAQSAVAAGVDIIKVHINCHHFASGTTFNSWSQEQEVIKEIIEVAGSIPVGIVTGEERQPALSELNEMKASGIDFWDLFGRFAPARFLDLKEYQKMVAIDAQWTPQQVQQYAALGVDVIEASIIPRDFYRTALNLTDLAAYKSLAESSPIPVLVPTQKKIEPEDLKALSQTGVSGITLGAVVTGLEEDGFGDKIASYRFAIDNFCH